MSGRTLLAKSILGALLASIFPSCAAYGAEYREIEITGYSGAEIWREIEEFARTRGFRTDPAETDVGRRTYQSRWLGQSVSFRRGNRKRFHARIVRRDPTVADFVVRFYVEVEQVGDSAKNMRPEEDDWEFAGQDGVKEREFLQVMGTAFPRKRREADKSGQTGKRVGR